MPRRRVRLIPGWESIFSHHASGREGTHPNSKEHRATLPLPVLLDKLNHYRSRAIDAKVNKEKGLAVHFLKQMRIIRSELAKRKKITPPLRMPRMDILRMQKSMNTLTQKYGVRREGVVILVGGKKFRHRREVEEEVKQYNSIARKYGVPLLQLHDELNL
ncbi:MAG: hypothetical protein V1776_02935 [Candidatus Diapherotrites archaeon]